MANSDHPATDTEHENTSRPGDIVAVTNSIESFTVDVDIVSASSTVLNGLDITNAAAALFSDKDTQTLSPFSAPPATQGGSDINSSTTSLTPPEAALTIPLSSTPPATEGSNSLNAALPPLSNTDTTPGSERLRSRINQYLDFTSDPIRSQGLPAIDSSLAGARLHNEYNIKTVHTIVCDICNEKNKFGALFQCTSCVQQLCVTCVEEKCRDLNVPFNFIGDHHEIFRPAFLDRKARGIKGDYEGLGVKMVLQEFTTKGKAAKEAEEYIDPDETEDEVAAEPAQDSRHAPLDEFSMLWSDPHPPLVRVTHQDFVRLGINPTASSSNATGQTLAAYLEERGAARVPVSPLHQLRPRRLVAVGAPPPTLDSYAPFGALLAASNVAVEELRAEEAAGNSEEGKEEAHMTGWLPPVKEEDVEDEDDEQNGDVEMRWRG